MIYSNSDSSFFCFNFELDGIEQFYFINFLEPYCTQKVKYCVRYQNDFSFGAKIMQGSIFLEKEVCCISMRTWKIFCFVAILGVLSNFICLH